MQRTITEPRTVFRNGDSGPLRASLKLAIHVLLPHIRHSLLDFSKNLCILLEVSVRVTTYAIIAPVYS